MGLSAQRAEAIIEITGKDNLSALIEHLNGRIKGMGATTAAQKGAVDQVRESWTSVATGVHSVMGIASQVTGVIGSMVDAAREFAEEEALDAAFRRAIPAADELMEKVDRMTGAQIRDDVVQKYAAQMARAGASADEIATSMELATKASNATGVGLETAIKGFADGLTKANDRGLKSLGINIDLQHALEEHARSVGKTAGQLSLAEQRAVLLRAAAKGVKEEFGAVDVEGTLIQKLNHADQVLDKVKDKMKGWAAATVEGLLYVFNNADERRAANAAANAAAWEAVRQAYIMQRPELAAFVAANEKARAASEATAKAALESAAAQKERSEAAQKYIGDLQKEADAFVDGKKKIAEHTFELYALVRSQGHAKEAAELLTRYNKELAEANGQKLIPSLKEQYNALKDTENAAIHAAYSMAMFAVSQNDAAVAAKSFATWISLLEARAGAKPRASGGGGGGKSAAEKAKEVAEFEAKRNADMRAADRKREQDERDRDRELNAANDAIDLARNEARDKKRRDAVNAAKQGLGDMLRGSTLTAFAGANQALASGSEQYMQGLAAFGEGLRTEFERIGKIMELAKIIEKNGGGVMDVWGKAAPGMISAIGQVGAAFAKDARWKYGILALAETGASIASFATLDFLGGGLHAAAAAQYGLAAAMAGGSGAGKGASGSGGGRGGSASKPGQTPGASAPQAAMQPTTIIISMPGATYIGSNEAQAGRDLSRIIDKHVGRYNPGHWSPP